MRASRIAVGLVALVAGCGRIGFDVTSGASSLGDYILPDEFGAGTFDGVTYLDGVILDGAARTGTFTSRVFALPTTAWTSLVWSPAAPYAKALPDAAASETGYSTGNLDMRDNIVLLHLDGAGSLDAGSTLVDDSGRDNAFTLTNSTMPGTLASYVPGRVGQALAKDKSLYGRRDIPLASDLQFGTRDFTWALWVNTTSCSDQNTTFWGNEDADMSPHIWLGCGPCPGGGYSIAGFYRGSSGSSVGGCGSATSIVDGAWHHVAVVKTAAGTDVRYAFYFDGLPGMAAVGPASASVDWTPPAELDFLAFHIQSFPDSPAIGEFDEAAIWARALDESELADVYARGALDLTLQVRFCAQADCSDNPAFVGPDGSVTTVFRDPSGTSTAMEPLSLANAGDTTRPYAQYRATFSTLRLPLSPRMRSVVFTVD